MLPVVHMNDYPARPPRSEISDADRVFPGDGVAPLGLMLRTLHENGFNGFLSLEVFNRDYWRQDAHLVCDGQACKRCGRPSNTARLDGAARPPGVRIS